MTLDELMQQYETRNTESKRLWKNAARILPGGISANVKYYSPFPLFMKEGHGAYLTDADGHKYIDYALSYGPLILGHGRKEIIEIINNYIETHGTWLFGTPHEDEAIFAGLIQKHYPSMEQMRFTNSGTEATLLAIRTAYAYTCKYKIAKFEGHYHGGFNEVLVSVNPDITKAGDADKPIGLRHSAGVPDRQLDDTIVLPFNDLKACKRILEEKHNEIAGVIMEPLLGGTLPATKEFMSGLRGLTKELGILLIMDEVKTGFRIGIGGAQEYYGVKPDLTTLGKIIGAGFPIGVLGGSKEIMEIAAPRGVGNSRKDSSEGLFHSGTYNGHPMILQAGMKTIEILEKELDPLIKRTERLKKGIKDIFSIHGIRVLTPGIGAMFDICITDQNDIATFRDLKKCDNSLRRRLDYTLLLEGIYNKPCKRYHMSTAHTEDVIGETLAAYKIALEKNV